MAGRKPLPSRLKLLRGTYRSDRTNPREPRLTPFLPRAPRTLSKEAKKYWSEVAPNLYRSGLLTALDTTALTLLAESWGLYRQAQDVIAKEGMTYKAGDLIKRHPAVNVAAVAWQQTRSMLAEFGMSPSSRSKVTAIEAPRADKLSRFLPGEKAQNDPNIWDEFLEEEKQQAMDERFFGSPESA